MSEEHPMEYYWFEIVGKVQAGSVDHARHLVYWSLDSGDVNGTIMVKELNVDKPIDESALERLALTND